MIGYEREGRYFLLFVSVHTMEVSVLDPMDFHYMDKKHYSEYFVKVIQILNIMMACK